jgi:calcineurin-like phosphoesterase family protein
MSLGRKLLTGLLVALSAFVQIFAFVLVVNPAWRFSSSITSKTLQMSHTSLPADPLLLEGQDEPLPAQAANTIRFVILSDTHGRHENLRDLPPGDVLVHLGDIAYKGNLDDIRSFGNFLDRQTDYTHKIILEGNHDRNLHDSSSINLQRELGRKATVLQDATLEIQTPHIDSKIRLLGVSWDTCKEDLYDQVLNQYQNGSIDILLTHGNPRTSHGGHGWEGSTKLTRVVEQKRIPLHLFGHVHWGRGIQRNPDGYVMVNCATAWNTPVVVDVDYRSKRPVMVHCPRPNIAWEKKKGHWHVDHIADSSKV